MRIDPLSLKLERGIQDRLESTTPSSAPSFAEELKTKFYEVDKSQHQADKAMEEGAVKGAENIHETMIRLEEAELNLRMLLKIRTKALDAYQEVMRMQF